MNFPANPQSARSLLCTIAISALLLPSFQAWAQDAPSNRPLLVNQSGAKPNLMIALDNSGSMAFTYHESYNVTNDFENVPSRVCPAPFSNRNSATLATFNAGLGGEAVYSIAANTYSCFQRFWNGAAWAIQIRNDVSVLAAPAVTYFNWSAQRSALVNPLYYDPRVRYLPRVDANGNVVNPRDPVLPATDPAYNVVWVSNQNSVNFRYTVYQRNVAPNDYRIYNSMYADNVAAPPAGSQATRNSQGYVNTLDPAGFTSRYSLPLAPRIPQHIAYTAAPVDGQATSFTYATCTNIIRDATGLETGCGASTLTNVRLGGTATFAIPTPNNRTDCTANNCTNAEEVANILNWYRWYSNRQLATSTAIGLALADTDEFGVARPLADSELEDQLRLGYLLINDTTIDNLPPTPGNPNTGGNTVINLLNTPGSATANTAIARGVRPLQRGSADTVQLFNWLYGILSRGGTPLHNAVEQAAKYYRMGSDVPALANPAITENPWRTVPTAAASDTNQEMSCRRSFNLLFSDGGWTPGAWIPNTAFPDFDNTNGPIFARGIPADPPTPFVNYLRDGVSGTVNAAGVESIDGRIAYVPFPSSGTGGLADITARYFWHLDLRPDLGNDVLTRPGQPTFWQNMSTYTVGYLIRPTGEVTGAAGLTFPQINNYITQYTNNGAAGATFPSFPTGDLLAGTATTQSRIDDFIHAGYTGGARSFSARSADDVKTIFNTILAEILAASGQDAGVSAGSGGGDNSTLAGRLKYEVSYATLGNSGNVTALRLNADGSESGVTAWSANQRMLERAINLRQVFTMTGNVPAQTPIDFNGTFASLPSDVRDALATGPLAARIPNGVSFINYLRGDNSMLDSDGLLFRQRGSRIAAMVNPPSVFMGDGRDFAYDLDPSPGGVDGRGSYMNFTNRKRGFPKSLFVATNSGEMHAFESETGDELAAIRPRRSLVRMLNFAAEPYNFEYVLDGPISELDIFDGSKADSEGLRDTPNEWRAWRHLGVGTGGRGEKVIYGVNSPINPGTPPNRTPVLEDFLWETGPDQINTADGGDVTLGFMSNNPRGGQTEILGQTAATRGRWIVAINNGHYNGEPNGEKSGLVVLDAVTGELIRTIPLPTGYSAGAGLSGITLLRSYGTNTRVVAAYAGDANGQLWKFNLQGPPSSWHVEHDRPLFIVPGNRPIYGHPAWQAHEAGGFIVVFATGLVLKDEHIEDLGQQTIYGIWDRQNLDGTNLNNETFTPETEAQLEERTFIPASRAPRPPFIYYAIQGDQIEWNTQRGWFIRMNNIEQRNLPGERSIANVQNFATSVIITSTVLRPPPEVEMCTSPLPANYVYVLNAQEASPRLSRSFDIDGDGRLDAYDSNADGRTDAGYAMAYVERGGFSRGLSVTRFRTQADGTPLADDPSTNVGNASDPQVAQTDSERLQTRADEGSGESDLSGDATGGALRCRTNRGVILGTGETPLGAGVYCPTTGWNRTQFQLSAPPSN